MIANQSSYRVNKMRVRRLVKRVLKGEGVERGEVSVAFVDGQEIKKINNHYRGVNQITDVLSFPHDGVGLEGTNFNIIGEVIISPEGAKERIEEALIHGVLHLLGYDHQSLSEEREMSKKVILYSKKGQFVF